MGYSLAEFKFKTKEILQAHQEKLKKLNKSKKNGNKSTAAADTNAVSLTFE
jgi:hypothetical protein